MKTSLLILEIVVVLVVMAGAGLFFSHEQLAYKHTAVEAARSNIDIQLQRRADLIPSLTETLRQYAEHETEVIDHLTNAYLQALEAYHVTELADADQEINAALSELTSALAKYPELTNSQMYIGMMDELAGTENRISYYRGEYNDAVLDYNNKLNSFPEFLFAGMLNYQKEDFFHTTK